MSWYKHDDLNVSTVQINIINPAPVVVNSSVVSDSLCAGDSTVLNAGGTDMYSWLPTSGLSTTSGASITAIPASTTTYTVTGTSLAGCTATSTVKITVTNIPIITTTPAIDTACASATTTLQAFGATSYSWQPGNLSGANVNVSPSTSVTYTVIGITNGCQTQ